MTDLARFLGDCASSLGVDHVVTDPDLTAAHAVDWTGRWRSQTPAVVRPGSLDDVVAVVAAARTSGIALVPQGGNTGLVGGSVPHHGEVVVDLRRLDSLEEVDIEASQVTAGAGVTLANLQRHVRGRGLAFGVDLGAREVATVGGMVATNAGGLHVLRHGAMRAQLLGVEAVLGTGEAVQVNMGGLLKDNTGYDLAGLLCGSEGTLGIITAARVRLVDLPPGRVVALLGVGSVAAAVGCLPALRSLPSLNALEVVLEGGLRVVADHLGTPPPLKPAPPCAVLVELAGGGDLLAEMGRGLERLGEEVLASAVADDEAGMARLWRWREAHSEAAAALGLVHKADVTLPLRSIAAFVELAQAAVERAAPGATTLVYGHLGDGNLHVNVVGPSVEEDSALEAIFDLVLRLGGSVSAEHGIGVAKRAWLERQRGTTAVAAMSAIKSALDPDGILNPAVLLP